MCSKYQCGANDDVIPGASKEIPLRCCHHKSNLHFSTTHTKTAPNGFFALNAKYISTLRAHSVNFAWAKHTAAAAAFILSRFIRNQRHFMWHTRFLTRYREGKKKHARSLLETRRQHYSRNNNNNVDQPRNTTEKNTLLFIFPLFSTKCNNLIPFLLFIWKLCVYVNFPFIHDLSSLLTPISKCISYNCTVEARTHTPAHKYTTHRMTNQPRCKYAQFYLK